ncbi:MAG: biopolymer transporter ExbD [Lentisphaeraceae bacterium]|nr:biopolymer transporter ExbD [Lentisphaeraceae bacterium]
MKRLSKAMRSEDDVQNVDMTPLIDMVFILLIFFIVTTVFAKDKGMDIQRPSQQSSGELAKENLLVAITAEGNIRVGGQPLSINSLRAYVSNRLRKEVLPVVLLADKNAPVGLLADVMDECRMAGAKNISLATEKEK